MMLFLRKYGFLFIPPVYWLIYLGARLTYTDWQESFLLISFRVFDMKASILSVVCVYFIFSA